MRDLAEVLAAHRAPRVEVDLARMQRDRLARLRAAMAQQAVDVAVLLHGPHVGYATGLRPSGADVTHAVFERPVAVVVADGDGSLVLDDAMPELDEGALALGRWLSDMAGPLTGRRVAVDEQTGAMLRAGVLDGAEIADAAHVVGAAKLCKTDDELECIAAAQLANEEAMVEVQRALVPGATRAAVAGLFLRRLAELGAGPNMIDPIFQVMPRRVADGPRATTGHVAFPTGAGETFDEGDAVWVDTGIDHEGYASDFGRTWIVGRGPTAEERALFARWCEVMHAVLDVVRPGATGGDLCRAAIDANAGARPWLPHFYLAHGVGIESAEMPLIGTDLGDAFDDALVLAPGMVLVLEPVIWQDGVGGYRAEEIIAVTDDGWRHLGGGHGYGPFDE
jgi:Xaa-Pro aminopeptidase